MRFPYANRKRTCGTRSSSSGASSVTMSKLLLVLSALTSGRRFSPAYAAARVWNRYRTGLEGPCLLGVVPSLRLVGC